MLRPRDGFEAFGFPAACQRFARSMSRRGASKICTLKYTASACGSTSPLTDTTKPGSPPDRDNVRRRPIWPAREITRLLHESRVVGTAWLRADDSALGLLQEAYVQSMPATSWVGGHDRHARPHGRPWHPSGRRRGRAVHLADRRAEREDKLKRRAGDNLQVARGVGRLVQLPGSNAVGGPGGAGP